MTIRCHGMVRPHRWREAIFICVKIPFAPASRGAIFESMPHRECSLTTLMLTCSAPCWIGHEVVAQLAFTNVTVGSGFESFTHSPNYLAAPGSVEWTMGGFGIADFNNDGWPDIFLPRGGVGTDRLYLNNGNGTFSNVASSWAVASAHAGNGVSCADFDRDGDVDIYMTSYGTGADNLGQPGRHRLYRNDGASFTDVALATGLAYTAPQNALGDGAAWGDIDLDGDLDLVVAGWSASGVGNRLFRNDRDPKRYGVGAFTDVTGSVINMNQSWGFQPTVVDITGDGFPEVLLAADFSTSRAYRNTRDGNFVLANAEFGTGIDDNGMGSCIGDFDRNGAPDWYVTSIHIQVPNPGMHNGNVLYLNSRDGVCAEVATTHGCADGGWGWGTVAADFDGDGWEDIVEVNGRNAAEWANESEYIYRNTGDGYFVRTAGETGFALAADSRAVGTFDYDRDGDLDLLVMVNAGPVALFRNDSARTSWIEVDLVAAQDSRCAPHGFGAIVECLTRGQTQRRWVHSGSGFHSSSEPLVHFGLAASATIDRITVLWPSGQSTQLPAVAPNQRLTIHAPLAEDLECDGSVNTSDAMLLLAQWGARDRADRDMRRADINSDGVVDAQDLARLLAAWTF